MSTESAAPAAPIEAAIILAAGRGNRISSMSSTPKPLLSMSGAPGGPSFLDFHLRHLAAHGVKDVVIVGNSVTARAPLRAILQLAGKVKVQIVENPTEDLTTSGSGHSLWFALQAARHLFDGQRRVLFMDADIAYDDDIFARLAAADPRRSATLVAPRTAADSEEVVVWADPEARHNAIRHGKGLWNTPLVEGLVPVGEATGVVMVAPADHERFLGLTDWAMKSSTAKTRSEHEDLTQLLMGLDRVDVVSLDVATSFMEVDTPADYEKLTTQLWPALASRRGQSLIPTTLPPRPATLPPMPSTSLPLRAATLPPMPSTSLPPRAATLPPMPSTLPSTLPGVPAPTLTTPVTTVPPSGDAASTTKIAAFTPPSSSPLEVPPK